MLLAALVERWWLELLKLDDVIAIHSSSELRDFKLSNVFPVKLDITSSDAISRFINEYSDQLTQVTLVHSAAVSRDNLAATLDVEDYQTVVDVNLRGNFLSNQRNLAYHD